MYNGIINVYKEAGYTSHDVVARLRGICKMKKIGVHPNENTASVFLPVDELLNIIREHGNSLEIMSFL